MPMAGGKHRAASKKQRRLFGVAEGVKKGEVKRGVTGPAVRSILKNVGTGTIRDIAATPEGQLPEKKPPRTGTAAFKAKMRTRKG